MGRNHCMLFILILALFIQSNNSCSIDTVTNWLIPVTLTIQDIDRGIFYRRSTTNIEGIISNTQSEGLNRGPYITISHINSEIIISTNDAYEYYENYETEESMGATVIFRCSSGLTSTLIIAIDVTDTNNNSPELQPTENYEFLIAPPVPPGFLITDCINDIIARDIDLTTERIDFGIENNPFFEISYDNTSSVPKEYKAVLKTIALIRTLPEPVILTISATDVDRTNDPRRTTYGTIKIVANNEFQFPDEPVFSQPFYIATYSSEHEIHLEESIYLRQGYDEQVNFILDGVHKEFFELDADGNQINLIVKSRLTTEVLSERQIYLVVKAEKQDTSGAAATIIVHLPEARELNFLKLSYSGTLKDNTVNLETIILNGNDVDVNFTLTGDYARYFSVNNLENGIFIEVDETLPENVISENDQLILTLSASGANTVTNFTSIFLTILKDDTTTPVFERTIYYGTYVDSSTLDIEAILLAQGQDDTVTLRLTGDHAVYFDINNTVDGAIVILNSSIPEELINSEKVILFNIIAEKPLTVGGNAVVSIRFPEARKLNFLEPSYSGTLKNNFVTLDIIKLNGYDVDVNLTLTGAYAGYFSVNIYDNNIFIEVDEPLPENVISENDQLILTLSASGANIVTNFTSIFLTILKDDTTTPVFERTIYYGTYVDSSTLEIEEILLAQGQDGTVTFHLTGDNAGYFNIIGTDDGIRIILNSSIPKELIYSEKVILFNVIAEKSLTVGGNAVISIRFPEELIVPTILRFSQNAYQGNLNNNELTLERIILESGYTIETNFELYGEYKDYFTISNDNNIVLVELTKMIEDEEFLNNNFILLEIEASTERSVSVSTSVIIDVTSETTGHIIPVFNKPYYTGSYTEQNGLVFNDMISLAYGYDEETIFNLKGDNSQWFSTNQDGVYVSLVLNTTQTIPEEIVNENRYFLFTIEAIKPEATTGRAAILIDLLNGTSSETQIKFSQDYFIGYLIKNTISLEPITLEDGNINNVFLELSGGNITQIIRGNGFIILQMILEIPADVLEARNILVLSLIAITANSRTHTTVILEVPKDSGSNISLLVFEKAFYIGTYSESDGFHFNHEVVLTEGFEESVRFTLGEDDSSWFSVNATDNTIVLSLTTPIPPDVLEISRMLVFTIIAENNRNVSTTTTIIIEIVSDKINSSNFIHGTTVSTVNFDKTLYRGLIQEGVVTHETIIISGYNGTKIAVTGDHADLFIGNSLNGTVTVTAIALVTFPDDILYIALQLNAAEAAAVLLLNVVISDQPIVPNVTFSSPLYSLQADITQRGTIGHVYASADNGEPVSYSLIVNNDHLLARLSVNNAGEINLSATVNSGVYSFQVTATTIVTQVYASAQVSLRVDAITVCGTDIVLPPLIILDRLEEEPHRNLVVLNRTQYESCYYSLTNNWPVNQSWLYIDDDGLHAESIDREHESIAFMTLSQIQVELVLHCESDDANRVKRSLTMTPTHDNLDPYDYGSKNWILTDTILYNARRSVVNLIVVDINDNTPIFIGKEREPIYVGYPIPEIEAAILPKVLVEVKATDSDVGVNAAIMYWSTEENLAVSPNTGYVHVRQSMLLEDNMRLTINATDQNGLGHTGSIDIVVKLLDTDQIAVVTVQNGFLDDETSILNELTEALGYDIKVLRTIVTSDTTQENGRSKRDTNIINESGTSLLLYVYGILDNEPVNVDQLTSDINSGNIVTVNIAKILSLEDHLQGLEICEISGRDTALLVSTIVLAVVLFILIAAIAVWYFLKWKKNRVYDQFSDENSLASPKESLQDIPKVDIPIKPRLDMDKLRKSERRLQEMLNDPGEEINSVSIDTDPPRETTVTIATPEPQLPIVIQSIDKLKNNADDSDDDDEFGERLKAKRKSVVTFNENVEKIIHIEDIPESPTSELEVYKF